MKPLFANGAALLAALTWGVSGVPQKTVLDHLDPFTVTGLTCILGAPVIWPLARRELRATAGQARPTLADIMAVALPFTVGVTFSQIGYGVTSVTNAGFFTNTAAVITPFAAVLISTEAVFGSLFAVLLINETLLPGQVAGAALVIVGVFIVAFMQDATPHPAAGNRMAHAPR